MGLEVLPIDSTQKHVLRNALLSDFDVDFKNGRFSLKISCLSFKEVLRICEMVKKDRQ